MAADLCMGTADDRVGDDHICLRTLTNDQLRIVHNCKALARVHLDQSSNCSRGRRDAAGHRGSIIIIHQTSRRIPVFVIVIPVGITLCILLGMNCIADDYRGNGQDGGNYQKRDQNCGHCRNNSAPGRKVRNVFIESIFEHEEEHRQQFKHANKVCCQRHPSHGIHSGNCSNNDQDEKYDQEDPPRQRFSGFCATNIFNCQQLCIQQARIRKIGKHARLSIFQKAIQFSGDFAGFQLNIKFPRLFRLIQFVGLRCRNILILTVLILCLKLYPESRHKKCNEQNCCGDP